MSVLSQLCMHTPLYSSVWALLYESALRGPDWFFFSCRLLVHRHVAWKLDQPERVWEPEGDPRQDALQVRLLLSLRSLHFLFFLFTFFLYPHFLFLFCIFSLPVLYHSLLSWTDNIWYSSVSVFTVSSSFMNYPVFVCLCFIWLPICLHFLWFSPSISLTLRVVKANHSLVLRLTPTAGLQWQSVGG